MAQRRVSIPAHLLIGLVQAYRMSLSMLIGRSCRFLPTCSEYAIEALRTHGAARGGWLALKRVGRCHPWGGEGFDPVPPPNENPGRGEPGRD